VILSRFVVLSVSLTRKDHYCSNNFHLADKQTIVFSYQPGDILRIEERQTCIVNLYSLRVGSGDPDAPCTDGESVGSSPTWTDAQNVLTSGGDAWVRAAALSLCSF